MKTSPLILVLKMKTFLILLVLIPFIFSCNQKTNSQNSSSTVIIPAEPSKFGKKVDCYQDRNTVKIVSNRSAKVLKSGEYGILDCYELGTRYQPCELPDWAEVGVEVKISGVVKEVRENERREGTPFLISEIVKP